MKIVDYFQGKEFVFPFSCEQNAHINYSKFHCMGPLSK